MADEPVDMDQQKIGELAYMAEVAEFNEPGGMMDQYTAAMGHLIYLESEPAISIRSLKTNLGSFVLGDSCEPKGTIEILRRCRDSRIDIIQKLKNKNPDSTIQNLDKSANLSNLDSDEIELFNGTLGNRNLLYEGLAELEKDNPNHESIGRLLSDHHEVLRDVLQVSTPKIESMMDAALNGGALGGKINGSGGGGCMFDYAPHDPGKVAEAIEKVGGKAYIIEPDEGTRID